MWAHGDRVADPRAFELVPATLKERRVIQALLSPLQREAKLAQAQAQGEHRRPTSGGAGETARVLARDQSACEGGRPGGVCASAPSVVQAIREEKG